MKILLIDVDSKMPNLALMKLSAWRKRRGDEVRLWRMQTEDCATLAPADWEGKIYVSCVFSENAWVARAFGGSPNAEVGGYGVNGAKLPDEIEHTMPDYDLYDFTREKRVGMGYTSRGCDNSCPWCVIPRMEGCNHDHAPITEFLPPDFDKVILLDPNFLQSPRWSENMQFITGHGIKVNFCQGLDIRLINEENAAMLAECRFYNWKFTCRQLHFAFDTQEIEPEVRLGVRTLKDAGIKPRHLMFYVLVGFDSTFEEDMRRFEVLRELGVDPFVMVYNNRRDIPILRHFGRWVNKRVYKACGFEDYDKGDSQEVIARMKSFEV